MAKLMTLVAAVISHFLWLILSIVVCHNSLILCTAILDRFWLFILYSFGSLPSYFGLLYILSSSLVVLFCAEDNSSLFAGLFLIPTPEILGRKDVLLNFEKQKVER